jgi:heat shock protein HslJ
VVYGNKVNFNKSMAMTKMACEGEGESTFVDALKKIDTFTINGDNTLSLNAAGIETLRLVKVIK